LLYCLPFYCKAGKAFVDEAMEKLSIDTDAVAASQDADLVVEAIVENLEVKQKLFKTLDTSVPP